MEWHVSVHPKGSCVCVCDMMYQHCHTSNMNTTEMRLGGGTEKTATSVIPQDLPSVRGATWAAPTQTNIGPFPPDIHKYSYKYYMKTIERRIFVVECVQKRHETMQIVHTDQSGANKRRTLWESAGLETSLMCFMHSYIQSSPALNVNNRSVVIPFSANFCCSSAAPAAFLCLLF